MLLLGVCGRMEAGIIHAAPGRAAAIVALSELFGALRMGYAFVGRVAEVAWLGGSIQDGPVDVLALTSPERASQVPMMASHRGFAVTPEEVQAAEELDLIPMQYLAGEERVRVHILMATNALYSRMIRDGIEASMEDCPVRVVRFEDLALLLVVDESPGSREKLETLVQRAGKAFDIEEFNQRLSSIGLSSKVMQS